MKKSPLCGKLLLLYTRFRIHFAKKRHDSGPFPDDAIPGPPGYLNGKPYPGVLYGPPPAKKILVCPKCGKIISVDLSYGSMICPDCGCNIVDGEAKSDSGQSENAGLGGFPGPFDHSGIVARDLYCPECGAKIEGGLSYCPKCGCKGVDGEAKNEKKQD